MKTTMNITAAAQDLDRFESREVLRRFYKDKGLDGLELMLCGAETCPEKIPAEDVIGVHLRYYPSWLDFYRGDRRALLEEYGSPEVWEQLYGGPDPEILLRRWERELDTAQRLGAEYVVFHVAECRLGECLSFRMSHTDREVCQAAGEIINRLLEGKNYSFAFLVENLWWSGLNLTDPETTRFMMDSIRWPRKGIMLDTGHLLHTDHSLRTQEEGLDYIHRVLDRHGELCRYIRGIHLHQSLSGAYAESVIRNPPPLTGDYWERLRSIYPHIGKLDSHRPFTAEGVGELIRRIGPDYLTHELITGSLAEHERALTAQLMALGTGNP